MTVQLVSIDVPDNVRCPEAYYERTVQGWHATLGPHHTAIDIDLLGYCPRCAKTLYLIEAARADAERKPLRVIARLAQDAGAAAMLVEHLGGELTRWRATVYPGGVQGSQEWQPARSLPAALARVRELHGCGA